MSDDESTRLIDQRIRDLTQEIEETDPEDLSDEDIELIKAEWQDIHDDLMQAMRPLVDGMTDVVRLWAKNMQPLVELAEECDLPDTWHHDEWTVVGYDTGSESHVDRCNIHDNSYD